MKTVKRRKSIFAMPLVPVSAIMFRSFLKGHPMTDAQDFRDRVVRLLRALYPGVSFEAPEQTPDVIIERGTQFGLQNLKAKFEQSDRSQKTLEKLVADHFSLVLQDEPAVPDFAVAQRKLKPQLMPLEYAKQAPIITLPFGQTLAIGIVLDSEKGYSYLRREDALRWKKSDKELLDVAIANLDEASRKMPMQAADGDEAKWVAIETKDGFDAARVLVPNLRRFISSRLGSPFRFAVPNRDFLICWNTEASARFSEFTNSKVRKDFEVQPYPLSPHVFEIADDGTITEQL